MNNQDEKVIVDYNDDWCFGCRGPDCEIVCCEGPCARSFCLECLGLKKFQEDEEWFCSQYCARSVQDICKEIKVKTTKNYPTPGKLWYAQTEDDVAELLGIEKSEAKKFLTYRKHMQYRVRNEKWKIPDDKHWDEYHKDVQLEDVLEYMKNNASEEENDEDDEYVNRRIEKYFNGIPYGGRVKSKDIDDATNEVIYLVLYDDGDKEDFSEEGLQKVLIDEEHIDNNDDVCYACNKEGTLLMCDGPCCRSFCLRCLGATKFPEKEEWFCCESRCGKTVNEIFSTLEIPSNVKSVKLKTSELWLCANVEDFQTKAGVTEENAKRLDAYREVVKSRSKRRIRATSCDSWEKLQVTLQNMGARPAEDFEVYVLYSSAKRENISFYQFTYVCSRI